MNGGRETKAKGQLRDRVLGGWTTKDRTEGRKRDFWGLTFEQIERVGREIDRERELGLTGLKKAETENERLGEERIWGKFLGKAS